MSTKSVTKEKIRVTEPKLYNVILHNDDQTSMEIVVEILMIIFHHNENAARDIMLKIHEEGKGVAGTYQHEIAEQKTWETKTFAANYGYPLEVTCEEV